MSFHEIARPLDAEGVIRWAHPDDAPGQFSLGVEFEDLDSGAEKILRLVRAHEKSKTRGPRTAVRHKEALSGGLVPTPIPTPKREVPDLQEGFGPRRGPRWIGFLVVILVLVGAGVALAPWLLAETRENYHRFGTGSRWVCSVRVGEQESLLQREVVEDPAGEGVTVETGPPASDDGIPRKTERSRWRIDGSHLVYVTPSKRAYRVYRFGSGEGDKWVTRPGSIPERETVHQGVRSLKVKAGLFENALRVRFSTFEPEEEEHTLYLVPEVGVVLRESVIRAGGRSRPRREELREYSLVPAPGP